MYSPILSNDFVSPETLARGLEALAPGASVAGLDDLKPERDGDLVNIAAGRIFAGGVGAYLDEVTQVPIPVVFDTCPGALLCISIDWEREVVDFVWRFSESTLPRISNHTDTKPSDNYDLVQWEPGHIYDAPIAWLEYIDATPGSLYDLRVVNASPQILFTTRYMNLRDLPDAGVYVVDNELYKQDPGSNSLSRLSINTFESTPVTTEFVNFTGSIEGEEFKDFGLNLTTWSDAEAFNASGTLSFYMGYQLLVPTRYFGNPPTDAELVVPAGVIVEGADIHQAYLQKAAGFDYFILYDDRGATSWSESVPTWHVNVRYRAEA